MDRYSVEKSVGEGSYGQALLARRRSDGRRCVVKRINLGKLDAKARAEAEQEAALLAKLRHPNIVAFVESFTCRRGSGRDNGGGFGGAGGASPALCIVMEWCDGGDLEASDKHALLFTCLSKWVAGGGVGHISACRDSPPVVFTLGSR